MKVRIPIWRSRRDGSGIVDTENVEFDVMTSIQFPHCDSLILHSPGVCEHCDRHPDWQYLRSAQGIAFSDTPDDVVRRENLIPCPSTHRRPADVRDLWPGNTAAVPGQKKRGYW